MIPSTVRNISLYSITEAVEDADDAINLNQNNVKAYLRKG